MTAPPSDMMDNYISTDHVIHMKCLQIIMLLLLIIFEIRLMCMSIASATNA